MLCYVVLCWSVVMVVLCCGGSGLDSCGVEGSVVLRHFLDSLWWRRK